MLSYTCAVNTSFISLFIFVLNTTLALLPNRSILNLHYWSRSPHGGWEPLTAFNSVALIQLSANLQHGAWKKLTAPAPAVITLAFVFPMWWISPSKALITWLMCHYTIRSPAHVHAECTHVPTNIHSCCIREVLIVLVFGLKLLIWLNTEVNLCVCFTDIQVDDAWLGKYCIFFKKCSRIIQKNVSALSHQKA